jgi:predicted kinase
MGADPTRPVSIAEFDYRRLCTRSGGPTYLTKLARSDDLVRLREALRRAAAGVVPQGKRFPRQVLWVAGVTRRQDSPGLDLMAIQPSVDIGEFCEATARAVRVVYPDQWVRVQEGSELLDLLLGGGRPIAGWRSGHACLVDEIHEGYASFIVRQWQLQYPGEDAIRNPHGRLLTEAQRRLQNEATDEAPLETPENWRKWFPPPTTARPFDASRVDEWVEALIPHDSAVAADEDPHLVLVLGPICGGKTTLRRQEWPDHIPCDPAEVYRLITDGAAVIPINLGMLLAATGRRLMERALSRRRRIAIEAVPSDETTRLIERALELATEVGYHTEMAWVRADKETCHKRNQDRAWDDISSFDVQAEAFRWLIDGLEAVRDEQSWRR